MSEHTEARGFWRSIPGLLTAAAATVSAIAALVAALSEAGVLERGQASSSAEVQPLAGEWAAQIDYPWNVSQREAFTFRVEDGRVIGTATFLGVPRAIEEGRLSGEHLTFTTRYEELLGDELRSVENRYDGLLSVRALNFVLQDSRGYGPIEFTARKHDAPRF